MSESLRDASQTRAVATQTWLSPAAWQIIQAIAPTMHQSRFFSMSSPEQACAIMIKGAELGLSFSASFEFIQVIQSKPTLSPRGALALVLNSGLLEALEIKGNNEAYTCHMKRRGGFEHTETFTMDDAHRAQLVKPDGGWAKYPRSMLKWRAVGFCIDVLFSDVCGGMKRADELGATIDDAGNVVEGAYQTVPTSPAAQPVPTPTLDDVGNWGLEKLIDKYGPAAVLEVCNGTIPTERSAIAAAWRALETREREVQEPEAMFEEGPDT